MAEEDNARGLLPFGRGTPSRRGYRVVVIALAEGTASQIVHGYRAPVVQVNERIAPQFRTAAVRHCVEQHPRGCYTSHCIAARGWLRAPSSRQHFALVGA
jgi:hypothetical protein